MIGTVANSTSVWFPSTTSTGKWKLPPPRASLFRVQSLSLLSTLPVNFSLQKKSRICSNFPLKASSSFASVGIAEYTEEPATNVTFQTSLTLPGCSSSLSLLGTGYREKVFAILGVKIYAAGLYINQSISDELNAWRGRSAAAIQEDYSLFNSIFQCNSHINYACIERGFLGQICPLSCERGYRVDLTSVHMAITLAGKKMIIVSNTFAQTPSEKSLQIVLVRDVDGKTFWDALDDAISPRINSPTSVDESALSTFRSIFQGRSLKKGTFIFLIWLEPPKMLVSISVDGPPSGVEATIESNNVTSALFDVFFGNTPVSPSLKASVATGLATILK